MSTEDILSTDELSTTGLIVDDEEDFRYMMSLGVLGQCCRDVREIDSTDLPLAQVAERVRTALQANATIIFDGNYHDGTILDLIEELGTELEAKRARILVITAQDGLPGLIQRTYPTVGAFQKPIGIPEARAGIRSAVPFKRP